MGDILQQTSLEQEKRLERDYLMTTYARKDVEFIRGSGMHLFDDRGRKYTDFLSGVGVVCLGHCHPKVTKVLQEQVATLVQSSNYYYAANRGEVAQMLSKLLEASGDDAIGQTGETWRTFFCNSGAEANEGAIKLARHYGNDRLDGATGIVCANRSFHGRTLATVFATGQPSKQEAFLPKVPGFVHVPVNDVDALEAALDSGGIAALLLEPIIGEGGVIPLDDPYLKAAREMTLARGQLLMLDEVQTGIYRTGTPFAFQQHGIVPDVVTMAKGLGGGVPIGAFAAREQVAEVFKSGEHGSTFGGNPLAMASALAVLHVLEEEGIADNVREVGDYLGGKLAGLSHVVESRGCGLMRAAELDVPSAAEVVESGLDHGLVLNYVSQTVLRFLPPLICTFDDVDILIDGLGEILGGIS